MESNEGDQRLWRLSTLAVTSTLGTSEFAGIRYAPASLAIAKQAMTLKTRLVKSMGEIAMLRQLPALSSKDTLDRANSDR